jgi:hypothetical protein
VPDDFNSLLETVLACLKRMEVSLLGMKKMRRYLDKGLKKEMLEALIEEAESQIAELKEKATSRGEVPPQ